MNDDTPTCPDCATTLRSWRVGGQLMGRYCPNHHCTYEQLLADQPNQNQPSEPQATSAEPRA